MAAITITQAQTELINQKLYEQVGYRSRTIQSIEREAGDLFRKIVSRSLDLTDLQTGMRSGGLACRVVNYKHQEAGGVVYHTRLIQDFRSKSLPDTFYIKMLALDRRSRSDISALCCTIVEAALEQQAYAIALYCDSRKEGNQIVEQLVKNGFIKSSDSEQDRQFVYLILGEGAHKPAQRFHQLEEARNAPPKTLIQEQNQNNHVQETALRKHKRDEETRNPHYASQQPPLKRKKVARPTIGSLVNPRKVTLRRMYIHQIQQGNKTREGRINTGMFSRFRVGDYVRFFYKQNQNDDVVCQVTAIDRYNGFADMLSNGRVSDFLPEVNGDMNLAINIYHRIPGYLNKAQRFGVLGISLRVLGRTCDLSRPNP